MNDYPDDIKSILPMEGKLYLTDSNTNDVILEYTDFSSAEASYAALDDGSYTTYISLKLNSSGVSKIKNIDKYKTTTNSESGETTVNNLKIMFDKDEIAEVSYDDILLTGKTLRIATSKNLTSNSSINSKMNTNTIVCKLATIGKTPVVYKVSSEEFLANDTACYINYIIIGLATVCIIIAVYFIHVFSDSFHSFSATINHNRI